MKLHGQRKSLSLQSTFSIYTSIHEIFLNQSICIPIAINFLWKITVKSALDFEGDMEMREISNQLVLKGTTTVGIVCSDGVILSSDTRVTLGTFIAHKKGKKIYRIDEHIAMTISGSVADAQRVVEVLMANAQLYKMSFRRPIPIKAASRLVANLLFSSRYAPLIAQVLIGGIDDTGAHVFSLDPLGSLTEEKCVATGSGSPVAYGVLEDKYEEETSTKDSLPIVVHAVKAAMKRNIATGDSFDVAIIDEEGYRELSEEEKKNIAETVSETRRKV